MARRNDDDSVDLEPREREVLTLIAMGDAYKGIAAKLDISQRMVGMHVASMQDALRARSLPMLVARAFFVGLLSAELLPLLGYDALVVDGN